MQQASQTYDFPISAFQIPKSGRAYDLCSGWWPGMPLAEGHPAFQVLTYRTPSGQRNQRDLRFLDDNRVNFGFISELLMCTMHTGTHIDALSHVTCGPNCEWHGGHSANEELGDFGPLNNDASELPPIFGRGIMLDIPAALGLDRLKAHQAVGPTELETACERQSIEPKPGDVVLIRTGTMLHWPDGKKVAESDGCGLSLAGAQWLSQFAPKAVGADNVALEVAPSGIAGDPQPVHRFLLQEQGVPILEWVYQEELSRDGVSDFLFVCLPLTIRGATGSLVRPIAIV
jgi:kynurenine formamidase